MIDSLLTEMVENAKEQERVAEISVETTAEIKPGAFRNYNSNHVNT
jgi:hypothetical protein